MNTAVIVLLAVVIVGLYLALVLKKDDIKNLIMSEKKDEMYDQLMEQWKSELDVVTYDKRVQYVGVNQ